jgi:hypothetical protein
MATTFAAIRRHFAGSSTALGLIEQLTPTLRAGDPFIRTRRRVTLRDWATGKSSCFRHFEIVTNGDETDLSQAHGEDLRVVIVSAVLTIAYPALPLLGGEDELESLEDLVEADANQIRDCLMSPGNRPSADVYHLLPTVRSPERGADVWFQEIDISLQFRRAQTLT